MNYTPVPTIYGNPKWQKSAASANAKDIRNALESQDVARVMQLLTMHNNSQRLNIRDAYNKEYGRSIFADIKAEFQGDFRSVISGLLLEPMDFAAKYLEKSFGRNPNVKQAIDILGPLSQEEIQEMQKFFKMRFQKDLKDTLYSETSGGLRLLFQQMLENDRNENTGANYDAANLNAVELMAVLEVTPEKFEKFFISLLTMNNRATLRAVFYEYEKMNSDISVDKIVEWKFSGELRVAIKALVDLVRSPPQYYAARLSKSMEGWHVDHTSISIIVISHSEFDLGNIKDEYRVLFNRELAKDIKSRISGDYRRCILSIIGKK